MSVPTHEIRSKIAAYALGLGLLFGLNAYAHEEHEAAVTEEQTAAPRFAVSSATFGIVGRLQPAQAAQQTQELRLYVDRNDDNRPVRDAQLTLELDGLSLPAHLNETGAYSLMLPGGLGGHVAIKLQVKQGEVTETAIAELELDEHAHGASATKRRGPPTKVLLAGAATLMLFFWGVWSAWREHRQQGKNS